MSNIFSENLREWKETIGSLAVIVTLLQFLSGSIVCLRYMKTYSTGDSSGFSFVCGFFSCVLWLKYGLLKHDDLVILVNLVGALLFFVYVCIYFRYVAHKSTIVYQFLSICLLLFVFHVYIAFEASPLVALNRTGFISCIVTLVFIASPLTMLFHVIRVRSTETLPFPIILTSFFVSALWYIYGSIVEDAFMEFPNALGAVLSAFQLSLFVFCPSSSASLPQYNKLRQVI